MDLFNLSDPELTQYTYKPSVEDVVTDVAFYTACWLGFYFLCLYSCPILFAGIKMPLNNKEDAKELKDFTPAEKCFFASTINSVVVALIVPLQILRVGLANGGQWIAWEYDLRTFLVDKNVWVFKLMIGYFFADGVWVVYYNKKWGGGVENVLDTSFCRSLLFLESDHARGFSRRWYGSSLRRGHKFVQ